MKKIVLKFLLPLLIIGGGLLVAGGLVATKQKPPPVSVSEKAWLVSVHPVERKAWSPTLVLYGRVESLWASALTSALAADVAEVRIIEGDEVSKGDLLVRLDDTDARLDLAQREADLREAEARIAAEHIQHAANLEVLPREQELLALFQAEVDRTGDLVRKKVGAQSALDIARQAVERQAIAVTNREQAIAEHEAQLAEIEARRDRAEAARDRALRDVERSRIPAPFDGRISKVQVAPGKRVRVGDMLVELYDTGALVVRAQVPSRYLEAVRRARDAGQELRVAGRIDGVPVTARLRGLAGEVASGSGGVEALFEIEGGSQVLQQGRFVRLDLALPAQPDLIALPPESLYGTDRVYRVDDDSRMRAVPVERVGEARNGEGSLVLVRSDELEPGDPVISTQLPNAIDGLLVRKPDQDG
jgi:multidrug resistance efflux pump